MATSKVIYKGNLRTEATHLKSGQVIISDAPTDNQGRGEAFSPTDLLATSLASCMMTIMGIAANTHNIQIEKLEADVTKVMMANPRKVSEIIVELNIVLGGEGAVKEKAILEHAALTCPVFLSLSADMVKTVRFNYPTVSVG